MSSRASGLSSSMHVGTQDGGIIDIQNQANANLTVNYQPKEMSLVEPSKELQLPDNISSIASQVPDSGAIKTSYYMRDQF